MKKYKLVYEDKANKVIKGSLTGKVEESDTTVYNYSDFASKNIKKVYEATEVVNEEEVVNIKGSTVEKVTDSDEVLLTRAELEGKAE